MKLLFTILLASTIFSSAAQKKLDYFSLGDADTSIVPIRTAFAGKLENVTLVGLGEATHGDKTTFAFNFNMIKYLVDEQGFKTLIIETPNSTCKPLNIFILNDTFYTQAQTDTLVYKTLPAGADRDYQFASLIKWLKDYNLAHKTGKVSIRGMSLDLMHKEDLLNNDIKRFDVVSAQIIRQKWGAPNYSKLDMWNDIFTWQDTHNQLIAGLPDSTRKKLLVDFNETKTAFEFYLDLSLVRMDDDSIITRDNDKQVQMAISKDNFFWKLRHSPGYARKDSLNRFVRLYRARDSIMAANTLRQAGNKRAIVWAHNGHVERQGAQMMGDYLNKALYQQYFVVITAYSKAGTIVAWDPLQSIKPAPDPLTKNTTLKELRRRYDFTEGIIITPALVEEGYRMARLFDAGIEGTFAPSTVPLSSFNALVVLGQLYPCDMIEFGK